MRTTKLLLLLVTFTLGAVAQQQPTASPPNVTVTVDDYTKLHENVVKLVELMGTRQKIENNLDKMILASKDAMIQKAPGVNSAFVEEWGKRFRAQFRADDYVKLICVVYASHFTNDEIIELIQIQHDVNESKTPNVSPQLKEKIKAVQPSVMSEIMGGFTQLGSKLGAEVGQEIQTEHPEWVMDSKPVDEPAKK